MSPFNMGDPGLSGFFGTLKRMVTPPRAVRRATTPALRVIGTTVVGAGTGFLVGGLPGAVAGSTAGFVKGVKEQTSRSPAPYGRQLYQTLLPAAGAGVVANALTYIPQAGTATASKVAAYSPQTAAPAASYTPLTAATYSPTAAFSSAPAASPFPTYASAGYGASTAAPAGSLFSGATSVLASVSKAIGGVALKIGEQVGAVAILSRIQPGGANLPAYDPGVYSAGVTPAAAGYTADGGLIPGGTAVGPGGTPGDVTLPGSGGSSSGGGVPGEIAPDSPILAGPTMPLIVMALGVGVTWLLAKKRRA